MKNLFKEKGICNLKPMFGRSRAIKLNRINYELKSSNESAMRIDNQVIYLPTTKSQNFHISIHRTKDEENFIIESLSENPININNKYVFKALLHSSDKVLLGYNELFFKPPVSCTDKLKYNFKNYDDISKSDLSILIQGETGTGKTHLAKQIHESSNRHGHFIHLNLSAFSSSLIESELFGHKKGAFTGAICDKQGAIVAAREGTLFLDEIDSIDKNIQLKLLLFLDDKKFRPVGSEVEKTSNCRIVFASGQKFNKLLENNIIRRDFYYRISSGVTWNIKPLRNNVIMIDKIVNKFEYDENVVFDKSLINFYKNLNWPGNLRQFIGHLKIKKILSNSNIIKHCELDLRLDQNEHNPIYDIEENNVIPLKELKTKYVADVYNALGFNISHVSKKLDISTNTVRSILLKGNNLIRDQVA